MLLQKLSDELLSGEENDESEDVEVCDESDSGEALFLSLTL